MSLSLFSGGILKGVKVTTKVRVEYGRKVTRDFDSTHLGAAVEVEIDENLSYNEVYSSLYSSVRKQVDALLEGESPTKTDWASRAIAENTERMAPKAMPGEKISGGYNENVLNTIARQTGGQVVPFNRFDSSATTADIEDGEKVEVTKAKVFANKQTGRVAEITPTSRGGERVTIRIGNRDQIPGQYITAKTFDQGIGDKMKGLRDGDFVHIKGYFDAWNGNENREVPKYDLVVQELERE